ncbi:hypothetical protein ACFOW4_14495 [Micromonospora sp. GCM10011542]|uniref:hypothetical protein n=1 Tax=Micromonospora sp. GCM10011542 TaxID=3317337 RepID=UPI00361DBB6E
MTDPTNPSPPDQTHLPQPITTSDRDLADVPPIAQPAKRRKALLVAVGAATAVLLLGVGIVAALGGDESPAAGPGQKDQTRLAAARQQCSSSASARLGDDDRTLTLHGDGKESAGLDYNVLECFWRALDVPDSVVAEIEATRALDGRQTGDWDGMHGSWSYHPDSGLQMVITLTD